MPLRDVLIQLEKQSIVDYELAGHSCTRPTTVCEGAEEGDRLRGQKCIVHKFKVCFLMGFFSLGVPIPFPRFEIALKEGTRMLWKATTVQLKNVKAKNVASFFEGQQIVDSPAVTQAICFCKNTMRLDVWWK